GLMEEHRLVNVLAGVGTQLSAFTHDIRQLLAEVITIESILYEIADSSALEDRIRTVLNSARHRLNDIRRLVEHQALYLSDVVSNDSRRRRSRQPLREVFDQAIRFHGGPIAQHLVAVHNEVPQERASPPMYRSEISVVMANLLSNALKAAGEGGTIRGTAHDTEGETIFTLENTGQAVELSESGRLFEPFVSTSSSVSADLGQGMGLGLTIVRSILANNEAQIQFVEPTRGFASAIRITWRRR
ncbi:MAG: sensor histidine kinase, partial [Fimbriimonadaceae bacterium]